MFVAQNFLMAVAKILDIALTIYMCIIIARAVLSWVNPDPRNFIVQFLYRVSEPVLFAVRRRLPINLGGLDLSPIIVILAIYFAKAFLIKSLLQMAYRLG
ncbi:MAG: YggT family protein [Deltaproteobacteria bacterium]|nr:YggT family protein [Deltaproteobacteria bacterium]